MIRRIHWPVLILIYRNLVIKKAKETFFLDFIQNIKINKLYKCQSFACIYNMGIALHFNQM